MAHLLLAGAGNNTRSTLVPFPIEPRFAHADYQKVKMTRTVQNDKRFADIPFDQQVLQVWKMQRESLDSDASVYFFYAKGFVGWLPSSTMTKTATTTTIFFMAGENQALDFGNNLLTTNCYIRTWQQNHQEEDNWLHYFGFNGGNYEQWTMAKETCVCDTIVQGKDSSNSRFL